MVTKQIMTAGGQGGEMCSEWSLLPHALKGRMKWLVSCILSKDNGHLIGADNSKKNYKAKKYIHMFIASLAINRIDMSLCLST